MTNFLQLPNLFHIVADGSVAGELACICRIDKALLTERKGILIIPVDTKLRVTIGNEICEQEVMVRLVPVSTV